MALPPGVYESLITEALRELLDSVPGEFIEQEPLDPATAHRVLARHMARVVEETLARVGADEPETQLTVCNELLRALRPGDPKEPSQVVVPPARQLLSVVGTDASGKPRPRPPRPEAPLSTSVLLVNGSGEPSVGHELLQELDSADSVSLVCAFIKWAGFRILEPALQRLIARGGQLRVITSTYLGVTEPRALEALSKLGAQIRVTYEVEDTRLHAKAWLMERRSGFTTAFIGSSNLSRSALIDGLEWNVRVSEPESPAVVARFRAAFEGYWERFVPLQLTTFEREAERQRKSEAPEVDLTVVDVEPRPHQQKMLYELEVHREELGHHRNLVVAATGTGKTLVAAFDFQRLAKLRPGCRLLFIAHRQEILQQSRARFRAVLRNNSFGELLVDGERPHEWNHVFASIQSLHAQEQLPAPDHFDVVVVDEFHHATADTYRRVLGRLNPRELLGLTATPERSDGTSVADEFFEGRIATELRLWEALDQGLLCPFHYFGVGSEVDLSALTFRRGSGGYAVAELENVYTADDARVRELLEAARRLLPDLQRVRALGFCVSQGHARFMARRFNEVGLASQAITSETPAPERREALSRLESGALRVLFTVDLFNEGVDIPDVDGIFFLRPTDSPTLFLQQLGRGLRKRKGKVLTVIDLVGRHHSEFRLDRRLRALVGGTRRELERSVERGFGFLPPGCHVELDRVATEHVLENVRRALRLSFDNLSSELRQLGDVSLPRFLDETGLDLDELYRGSIGQRGLGALRRAAGFTAPEGPREGVLARAVMRCLHLDDSVLLERWREGLALPHPPAVGGDEEKSRQWRMLSAILWNQTKFPSLEEALAELWRHPSVRRELHELFGLLRERVDRRGLPLPWPAGLPLRIHCRYSLGEIFAAAGLHRPEAPYRSQAGVVRVPELDVDIFLVTLFKGEGQYAPAAMYKDYALTPTLFHWQSQAHQHADLPAIQRYIDAARAGKGPLLFVRSRKQDARGETAAYTLLGSVHYVKHEGSRPVSFTWKLRHEMPPDLYAAARAVSA